VTVKQPHILLTGGGTGGHIFPLVAVAERLRGKARVSVVVEQGSSFAAEAFSGLGVEIHEIKAGKLRRYHGRDRWKTLHPKNVGWNLRDGGRTIAGLIGSIRLLRRLQPDLIFCKGGYVALPVSLAGVTRSIPIVTHDSDILPGITNRIISRWAVKIAVGFPREHYQKYPAQKLVHVGVPIRADCVSTPPPAHKTRQIAVVGGSNGARAISRAILTVGKSLMELARVTHIAGKADYRAINEVTRGWQDTNRYKLYDFVGEKYLDILKSSDLVICRAGATTMAEAAAVGRPMIIVPNPRLTGGHQLLNSYAMEETGGAVVIGEPQLTAEPELLVATVRDILEDDKKRQWLVKNARSLFPADAAERLADLLLETAVKR
jgi:UDP-N-acetylglucosamine--N-acetylmuramyl-(pentapeptide) pyrophosphoryl-undecaprenol N-acetylglucosamine transferase